MKLIYITILSIVSLSAFGQDSFLFDKTLYKFDSLYEGEISNAVFLLKNTGKDTLYISVESYCSCIHVTYSEAPIYPGKCSMIQGQFNSYGKVGLFNDGMDVKVRMKSNADVADEQKIFLPIEAYIVKGKRPQTKLKFSSRQFDIGKVNKGEGKYYKLNFLNQGEVGALIKEIKITGVPFFYSSGLQHLCSSIEDKPLVGNNEIIHRNENGSILLKLGKTDLNPGNYESTITVIGNFKSQKIKLRFEVK